MAVSVQAFMDEINTLSGWHAEIYTSDPWYIHVSMAMEGKIIDAIIPQDGLETWQKYKDVIEKAMEEALEEKGEHHGSE